MPFFFNGLLGPELFEIRLNFVNRRCAFFFLLNSVQSHVEEAGKDEQWNVVQKITDVTTEANPTYTPYVTWESVPHGELEDGAR